MKTATATEISHAERENLTARQQEVFAFIQQYIDAQGYPPSRLDIMAGVGMKHVNSVTACLAILVRKGVIECDPHKARGIRVKNSCSVI